MDLIIIGGGNSIRALPELWADIDGLDVMAVNYAYKFLLKPPKYLISMDKVFWKQNSLEINELSNKGTRLINRHSDLSITADGANESFFCGARRLSGVLALSYATKQLKEYNRLFLFGFDFGLIDGKTHFYDSVSHSGIGKVRAYYDTDNKILPAVEEFKRFADHEIFIVGDSNINYLKKIDYNQFLEKIGGF